LKLVTRDATYQSHSIQLERGDKIVFYTDGIPECFNPAHEFYGVERFRTAIHESAEKQTARQVETAIVTDVMWFADNHPLEDDLTLAVIGVN
jgi:sigma-B regulation protein RsbU (phosphoserine phosphatase)